MNKLYALYQYHLPDFNIVIMQDLNSGVEIGAGERVHW